MVRIALVTAMLIGFSAANASAFEEAHGTGTRGMSLGSDINKGLAAISAKGAPALALDARGRAVITIPVPSSVAKLPNKQLLIGVRLSRTGTEFTLHSALGRFSSLPDATTLETLLHRNYYPEQTSGITYSISPGDNALVATFHWPLDAISSEEFTALVTKFSVGVLDLLRETAAMARNEPSLTPLVSE